MKILVTGGLGYIGSHTVTALCEAGHEVVIIRTPPPDLSKFQCGGASGARKELTGQPITFYEVDILDQSGLDPVFRNEGCVEGGGAASVGQSTDQGTQSGAAGARGTADGSVSGHDAQPEQVGSDTGIQGIIHFAAKKSVPESLKRARHLLRQQHLRGGQSYAGGGALCGTVSGIQLLVHRVRRARGGPRDGKHPDYAVDDPVTATPS